MAVRWAPMSAPGNYHATSTGGSAAAGAGGGGSMAAPIAVAALAGFQIWSGLQQAQMIRRQSELTQKINELNASYIDIDAYEAEKFGYTEAARYRNQIDSTIADQRSAYAADNVDVNYGTAAEVQGETQLVGFLNILDIQSNARARALGLRREASNVRLGAAMSQSQSQISASAAETSGYLSAANTGLNYYLRK